MSDATLKGLRDYLFSTLNIGSMYWLANELNEYAHQKETRPLKPYTMEEINAMIDQAERESALGLGQESEEMFRELEAEFAREEQEELEELEFAKAV